MADWKKCDACGNGFYRGEYEHACLKVKKLTVWWDFSESWGYIDLCGVCFAGLAAIKVRREDNELP